MNPASSGVFPSPLATHLKVFSSNPKVISFAGKCFRPARKYSRRVKSTFRHLNVLSSPTKVISFAGKYFRPAWKYSRRDESTFRHLNVRSSRTKVISFAGKYFRPAWKYPRRDENTFRHPEILLSQLTDARDLYYQKAIELCEALLRDWRGTDQKVVALQPPADRRADIGLVEATLACLRLLKEME